MKKKGIYVELIKRAMALRNSFNFFCRRFYIPYIKRFLGILISIIGLLFLWPIMIIIAIAIKLDSKGSVIFKQKRLGRNQKIFTIYKFRTMIPNAYELGGSGAFESDPRITRIGNLLRKSSLDELPQLINILKGEMCIIGPRPILSEEFEFYKEEPLYQKRFCVNPGLFCTVDLDYRATATREVQFKMDTEYAEQVSLTKDIKIFKKILLKVIKQENIYPNSSIQKEESEMNKME